MIAKNVTCLWSYPKIYLEGLRTATKPVTQVTCLQPDIFK
jgi:hypothetical protein